MLALAQDQVTLKIESAHAADDPQFPGYTAALLGADATGGNQYTVLTNGDQIFPAMLAAVNGARAPHQLRDLHLQQGHASASSSPQAFEAAASRGVQVHLVVDAMGSNKIPERMAGAAEGRGRQDRASSASRSGTRSRN